MGGLQRSCRLVFLILGVGRLREDQLMYVETRGYVFFIIWDLYHWLCHSVQNKSLDILWQKCVQFDIHTYILSSMCPVGEK